MKQSVKLSDIADIYSGYAFKSKDLQNNGIPVLKIKNVNNKIVNKECDQFFPEELMTSKLEKYLLEEDDILVAMTGQGSLGRVGKMNNKDGQYLVNQRVGIIRPKDSGLEANYLYAALALDTYEEQLFTIGLGAGQPNVSAKDIGNLDIPYPNAETRLKIGEIRRSYDILIENNSRRVTILEEIVQSLYREWFVKFRFPGHEQYKMVESQLGPIPERWEVKRLDDLIVLQRGFDLPKKKRNEHGSVPIFAASGINGYHDESKVKAPGLVTGRSGTLGVVNLPLEDFWPLNTALWVKEFKESGPYYAYYLLKSIDLSRFNSGASVPTLNRNDVHGHPVLVPPRKIIEQFEDIAAKSFKLCHKLKKKNNNLQKQRDLLLPKLISSQIDLSQAELT